MPSLQKMFHNGIRLGVSSPKLLNIKVLFFTNFQRNLICNGKETISPNSIFQKPVSSSLSFMRNYCAKPSKEEKPEKTMSDIKTKIASMMGVTRGFVPLPPNRSHLLQYLPQSQEELPTRSMKDSFDSALIPLSTDIKMQNTYMTLMGNVRKGRLLEDMDLFAVWICLKYIKNSKEVPSNLCPHTLVTASVDQITFKDWQCKVTDDLRISGQVQYAGKTSIEVCVWLESFILGEWKLFTKAYFIMVARNSTNTGGAFINQLKLDGPEEEEQFDAAKVRMQRRLAEQKISLVKIPPNPEEQREIHEVFMKTVDYEDSTLTRRLLPSNSVWMESTKISNMLFPHPEDKNNHNTVFGGLLMRLSSELSWIVAFTHAQHRPVLRHISDITFKSPVSMNSFVKMTGQVTYNRLNYMQITVHCELMDILTGKMITTNVFNFTYESSHVLREVVPKTYLESMLWLDGRRHFNESIERESSEKW